MFNRLVRFTLLVSFALASLLTVAGAQIQSKAAPPAPKENPIITAPANMMGGKMVKGDSQGSITPDSWTIGWNYFHIQNCTTYYWNGTYYLVMYFQEGPYAYTADTNFEPAIYPACQSGNWIAFYAYDYNGDWEQVWTYTFQ